MAASPEPEAAPAPAAPAVARAAAACPAVDTTPLIVVASDGNATLRVEQQPLEWVLEQIAAQSGWDDVRQRAAAPARVAAPVAPPSAACRDAPTDTPAETEQLLRAIERGGEAERYGGLLQARSMGVTVPDAMLKSLYETSTSERVRLLAFESYVEPLTGSGEALRSVLEAALLVSDGAVQREARRRLDELFDSERSEAAGLQSVRP